MTSHKAKIEAGRPPTLGLDVEDMKGVERVFMVLPSEEGAASGNGSRDEDDVDLDEAVQSRWGCRHISGMA
ncbi:hypothetical protein CVT26_002517 [Gymnopilus dilepis]|uniref:Uncharacterized protein n=1 Tax=Gymnopilus dilepis TaxID=231916 RepID=A0A409YND6_9AGAR|nr:hypothetical protein CVT26_002517 [Gymnopilus dilepis]